MTKITYITPGFAVASALRAEDFPALRDKGFKAIISNLPEAEVKEDDVSGKAGAKLAWQHGLAYRYLPADKLELFSDELVDGTEDALHGLQGPVLAYCRSGMRSAIAWAAASARNQPVGCVLTALENTGFDLDFLEEDLVEQAHKTRRTDPAAALDCSKSAEVRALEAETAA